MNFMNYDYYGNYKINNESNLFSINEIHKKQKDKEKNRLKIYENISQKCFKKIKETSLNEETFCFYRLPEYIPGLPLYNMTECVVFILNLLHEKGFKARYCSQYMIFISWTLPKPILKLNNNIQHKEIKKNIIDELNLKYKPIENYNSFNNFIPKKKF
jgi:hypothetical protein